MSSHCGLVSMGADDALMSCVVWHLSRKAGLVCTVYWLCMGCSVVAVHSEGEGFWCCRCWVLMRALQAYVIYLIPWVWLSLFLHSGYCSGGRNGSWWDSIV